MAVYTKISRPQLAEFLQNYTLGELRAYDGIAAGVSNTNYWLNVDGIPYVLTIFEPHRAAKEDIPFFIGYAIHLEKNSVTCPKTIKRKDGLYVGEISGKPAAIFSFLPGDVGSVATVPPPRCENAGKMLATMHLADKTYGVERYNEFGLVCWEEWFKKNAGTIDSVQRGLEEKTRRALDEIEAAWPDDLPKGTIHADYFPDNVFFEGNDVTGVIDFHFAATDFYAYDLAIALNAWSFDENNNFQLERYHALLGGYESVRPLTSAEREALPVLLQAGSIRFLLSRIDEYLHWPKDNIGHPHDPLVFLKRLEYFQANKALAA